MAAARRAAAAAALLALAAAQYPVWSQIGTIGSSATSMDNPPPGCSCVDGSRCAAGEEGGGGLLARPPRGARSGEP